MILVIDNFDSFTWNLVQLLASLGADVHVRRSDAITADEAADLRPAGLLISPGPCGPQQAVNARGILQRLAGQCPIFGVCLGHQLIADFYGARVERAPAPAHGRISQIHHDGQGMFLNLPSPFPAVRYHSLAVVEQTLPLDELEVTARSEGDDGLIMGLRHRRLAIEGVQFHPESIATEGGHGLMSNFLNTCARHAAAAGHRQSAPAESREVV